jgi:hypothetical protein
LEAIAVTILLALVISVQLLGTSSLSLFRRQFWLEEIFPKPMVSDPVFAHSINALAGGF